MYRNIKRADKETAEKASKIAIYKLAVATRYLFYCQ